MLLNANTGRFTTREVATASASDAAVLELVYAITVHKSQGSEFDRAILVLLNPCRLLSRELL